MSEAVYHRITEQILKKLEEGTVPWHKPWKEGFPTNLVSMRRYRGINSFVLGSQSYESPYWLSFRQASALGGTVRKGERSTAVVFWKWQDKEVVTPKEKKTVKVSMLRYYHVFNVEQTEGISYPSPMDRSALNPIDEAEKVCMGYENHPRIERGDQAFYRPKDDAIVMPKMERFENAEEYYSTLFHELTHSTGHEKRLDRKTLTDLCPFGSTNYSKEELIAEMGAAMLSAEVGIENKVIDNSASYIAGWLKRLRNDTRLVVVAAGQAQRAVDHILGRRFTIAESESSPNDAAESA